MTYLEEYYQQIERGDIIVCDTQWRLVEKYIREMKDGRWLYDTREAERRIAFQQKCSLQSKAPYYMKPVELMLWQKAYWESMYSFKNPDTQMRRFVESLLLVARKNGKSTMFASDANFDLFCGEGGVSICCASNDDKQSKLIWKELEGMKRRLDPNDLITRKNLVEIRNDAKDIEVIRTSARAHNRDGLNLKKVYLDESHDMDDEDLAEDLWRAMGSQDEPLLLNCTTQGFVNDGYLDKKLEYFRRILDGEIEDDSMHGFIFEQDSEQEVWSDERSWEKSNPSIPYGVKKTIKLRRDLEVAKHDNGSRIHMLCKDFNIKQNTSSAWLQLEDYDYPQEVWTLEDFRNAVAIGAVDLSETTDLTNLKILLMRKGDSKKYIYSHYWIPEGKLQSSDDASAGARYRDWAKSGILTIQRGFDNNLSEVADHIYQLKKEYGIRLIVCGYDQRFAKDFLNQMDSYGIKCEMIYQSREVLSSPMKQVEAELKAQLINYNGNEMDKWCLSNASCDVDNRGLQMAVKIKGQANKRIDGAVTLIILYATLQRYRSEYMRRIEGG